MSDVTVKMKLSQAQTGALYMKSLRQEDEIKSLYALINKLRSGEQPLVTTTNNPAIAAIEFAMKYSAGDDGWVFLKLWNEGDFESIRNEWPDAPPEVFIGAES